MVAAVVAIVAVVGVGLMLSQPPATSKPTTDNTPIDNTPSITEPDDGDNDVYIPPVAPDINYTDATYGVHLPDVEGDCKLYRHVVTDRYQCFGAAGKYPNGTNYVTYPTNEYRQATSEDYFCKPTVYGCRLYEKVYVQPTQ